jgi:hypothetical protein
MAAGYTIFEYLYRDASNYKAYAELLLTGSLGEADVAKLYGQFEDGEYFIAEQLAIPTLFESLWAQCESGPLKEHDHLWHEFCGVREANEEDIATLDPWGSAEVLLSALSRIGTWNLRLSRNWEL